MDKQEINKPNSVTITSMAEKINEVHYATLPNTTMTLCVLYMKNGHVVVGKSACVDPANYNQALGEKYAYEDAINQLWPLEGYLLSEDIYRASQEPKIQLQ